MLAELLSEQGIRKIARHRLSYSGLDFEQEVTWAKEERNFGKNKDIYKSNNAIITRGVMLNPTLYLAFHNESDAEVAFSQTVCFWHEMKTYYFQSKRSKWKLMNWIL